MGTYHHKDANRISQLKQLAFAEQSMLVAIDACKFAIKNDSKLSEAERMIVSAGLATIYSSPFTSNTGIGSLDGQYSRFADPELKGLHEALLDTRNTFYSHRDAKNALVNLGATKIPFHQVTVIVNPSGGVRTGTPFMFFRVPHFEKVIRLCEFQFDRINKKSCKLLLQLQARHKKPSGQYILGEDYP